MRIVFKRYKLHGNQTTNAATTCRRRRRRRRSRCYKARFDFRRAKTPPRHGRFASTGFDLSWCLFFPFFHYRPSVDSRCLPTHAAPLSTAQPTPHRVSWLFSGGRCDAPKRISSDFTIYVETRIIQYHNT